MAEPISPYELQPPPARRLWLGIGGAALVAVLLLFTVVLPAEYGIDPTGIGKALGLTAINEPGKPVELKDVIGGNQDMAAAAAKVPDVGDPIPLPNPAVSQIKPGVPKTQTLTVTLPPFKETEVKMLLDEAQVAVFSWEADAEVYVDYHGHNPELMGKRGFVRYEELQSTRAEHGSLVAPFSGEHGWYWLSLSDKPTTIKLTVTGYFNSLKDYGIFGAGP
jgi:hypothetical protein